MLSEKQPTANVMNCLNSILKKLLKSKTLLALILGLICLMIYLTYFPSTQDDTSPKNVPKPTVTPANRTLHNPHVLCVLVPFRDRFDELLEFIPHMSRFLNRQSIKYHIAIINHLPDEELRFNKGATFNSGFLIISKKFPECDYIALHDVDTLPLAEEVSYAYPGNYAYHGIPPGYHPVTAYSHPTYIGGILLMPNEIFVRMNGFGNNFWGWGFEDIDFHRRMMKYSVRIRRPEILSTDNTKSFKHIHEKNKARDLFWCLDQAQASNSRHRTDNSGLSNVNFTLVSENELTIDGFAFSVFNIYIKCDFVETPWCKPFCLDKPAKNLFIDSKFAENNAKINMPQEPPVWKFNIFPENNAKNESNPFENSPLWRFMSQLSQSSLKKKSENYRL